MSTKSRARVAFVAMLALALVALLPPALAAAASDKTAGTYGESFVIKSDGTLWGWGANANEDLGLGDDQPRGVPEQIGTATTWSSIVVFPGNGMLGLQTDGSLWRWGVPEGSTPAHYVPDPAWAGPWAQVSAAAGEQQADILLLTTGGQLWAFGSNSYGQFGDGTTTDSGTNPRHIGSDLWKSVAAGWYHSLGVKSDGSLWSWGANDHGQLGLGDKATHPLTPQPVNGSKDWAAVFAYADRSFALKENGDLYAWGDNPDGELGIGKSGADRPSPTLLPGSWTDVAPGALHTVAIATDGSLWGCGYNYDGELGSVSTELVLDMKRIGSANSWSDVGVGTYHTVAVTTDDQFAACGGNSYGQLGLGFSVFRPSPEQVGTTGGWLQVDASVTHAAGIRDDHSLWTWGYDIDGALGGSGGHSAPARVGYDNDWATVSCGAYTDDNYTLAVKQDGTLWGFGDNRSGQLGLGDKDIRLTPTQVGSDTGWVAVAASDGVGTRGRVILGEAYTLDDHSLGLREDGSLWAWGANGYGQLGLGDTTRRLTPARVGSDNDWAAVACGDDYSAALKTDGTLWVWGHNWAGQLGKTDLLDKHVPTQVTTGAAPETFKAFACGSGRDASHMLAVKSDGTLWGWGGNYSAELAQGWHWPPLILAPFMLSGNTDWTSVACGSSFGDDYSLATTNSGQLWAWGANNRGQLGNGDYVGVTDWPLSFAPGGWSTVVSGSDSFALKDDGTLWAWGDNTYGQLGLGDMLTYPSTSVYPLEEFVDTTPPTVTGTSASAVSATSSPAKGGVARGAGGWTRTARTVSVKASDIGGSGVGRAQISTTGGVSYVTRNTVTVKNGDVDVFVRAIDRVGNPSAVKHVGHWKVDTTKPKPAALGASVKRGSKVSLRYRIADYSPCVVRIAVKNKRGVTVKSITVKGTRPMSWRKAPSFRCTLAKGTYRFYVTATDSVGYKSVKAAVGKLVVK
jgi:alpha-tubulin suppressor-like RCC1 family protein